MEDTKISIITVSYNAANVIEKTIQSVINQTYTNIEYIIIDGGSTDGTVDIIKKYEGKLAYWISEPDKGIYDAMNKGIEIATGEWINFMNAGDGFNNATVLKKISDKNYFQSKDFQVLYGDAIVVCSDSSKRLIKAGRNLKEQWKGPIFRHGAMFVRTSIHKKNQFKLDSQFKICADFDLIYNLFLSSYSFSYVDEIIMYFERDGVSNSRVRCAKDNKMVVLSYSPCLKYEFWHDIHIIRAYFIDMFIKPLLYLLSNKNQK
ncbi:MAG: glycosyltransferase [Prevotella sp.]|nr:glycosyltransferase [Prevotella sp.]